MLFIIFTLSFSPEVNRQEYSLKNMILMLCGGRFIGKEYKRLDYIRIRV